MFLLFLRMQYRESHREGFVTLTLVAGLFFTFEHAHYTMGEAGVPDSHYFYVIMCERKKS